MKFSFEDLIDRQQSIERRFWGKVEKSDGCWLWTSATSGPNRYGVFWVGGRKGSEYAHRIAWMLKNRESIPLQMVVMHSCDNKLCVNPSHLSVGSGWDNTLDAASKGRMARGERNGGGGRLTSENVIEILQSKGVIGPTAMAKMFGVSTNTIKMIRSGRLWKHIHAHI